MRKQIDPQHAADVFRALTQAGASARTATKYIDPKTVVRATWRFKPNNESTRAEIVITFGAPNYLDRAAIKKAKKANAPLPGAGAVQLRAYPKKRVKK
jgi:hypothetical protein